MKIPIRIEQRNAGDYLGSNAILCDAAEAEFFVAARATDKFSMADAGLMLERDGIQYRQNCQMQRFEGIAFIAHAYIKTPWAPASEERDVTMRLIPAGRE